MIKYKDSGIAWIGKIPEDWEVDRIKKVLKERNEKNDPIKTENILSLTNDRGVIPYSEKGAIGNNAKEDLTGYKLAYPNDLVLNSMNVVIGSVGISKYFGAVSPVYYMLNLRNENESIEFYNYIFQTKEFQKYLKGFGNGILDIRMRIPMINLNSVKIPIVAPDKQHKIVAFLDKKCAQIDELIKLQEQEIEKLKEYKQSIITEVVTKGLDKNAKMKDSGIDWIGEIPEHWKVLALKNAYRNREEKYIEGQFPYIALENIECKSGKYVETETNSFYSLEGTILSYKNDVIFGKLRPYLAKSIVIQEDSCVSSEFAVFYSNTNDTEFLHFLFLSFRFIDVINSSTYGTKMPRANIDFIKNLKIALPPKQEQVNIVNYLKEVSEKINNLITEKNNKIVKLQDYKKSLIYEYVTGKKEV